MLSVAKGIPAAIACDERCFENGPNCFVCRSSSTMRKKICPDRGIVSCLRVRKRPIFDAFCLVRPRNQ